MRNMRQISRGKLRKCKEAEAPAAASMQLILHRPPQAEGDAAARDGCLVQRHNGAAMPNEPLRVLMFLGSTRAGRIGGRVGSWARRQLEARGHSVETVDPLALASHDEQVASDLRIFPMRRPYFFYPEAKAPPVLEQLAASVKAADAYVMVTPVIDDMQVSVTVSSGCCWLTLPRCLLPLPRTCVPQEYNHAPAPALLETLNHFGGSSFAFKPSCIVSYSAGQWGGTRAAVGLRPVLSELGCLPVSAMIHIPNAGKLFKQDGSLTDPAAQERWECVCF